MMKPLLGVSQEANTCGSGSSSCQLYEIVPIILFLPTLLTPVTVTSGI
jgi:hypothetical protein